MRDHKTKKTKQARQLLRSHQKKKRTAGWKQWTSLFSSFHRQGWSNIQNKKNENYSMILRKFSRSVVLPVLPRKSTFHQRTIVPHTAFYPTLYIKTLHLHITQFLQLNKFKIVFCDILKCVLGVLGGGIGETCTTNLWNFMRGIGRGPGWIWRITTWSLIWPTCL